MEVMSNLKSYTTLTWKKYDNSAGLRFKKIYVTMHYRSTEIDFVNEIDTLHSYSSLRNAAVAAPVNN